MHKFGSIGIKILIRVHTFAHVTKTLFYFILLALDLCFGDLFLYRSVMAIVVKFNIIILIVV